MDYFIQFFSDGEITIDKKVLHYNTGLILRFTELTVFKYIEALTQKNVKICIFQANLVCNLS